MPKAHVLIIIEGYIQQSDLMCASESELLLYFWITTLADMPLNTITINLINGDDLQGLLM